MKPAMITAVIAATLSLTVGPAIAAGIASVQAASAAHVSEKPNDGTNLPAGTVLHALVTSEDAAIMYDERTRFIYWLSKENGVKLLRDEYGRNYVYSGEAAK